MCGIAGVVDINGQINVNKLKAMTKIIRHRGPDDEGFYLSSKTESIFLFSDETMKILNCSLEDIDKVEGDYFVGFGHRRLSILDLSENGHQPMFKHNKIIVFNGEIYNYIEIRNDLESIGYEFVSGTDTEVILSAYDYWGEDCVKKFNGMWSFSIHDTSKNIIFCSRDRFGIKPFYYYKDGESLIFSSEIKQILEYGKEAKLNRKALHTFLLSKVTEFNDETFFDGIKILNPGSNMTINLSNTNFDLKICKYWELEGNDYYDNMSYEVNCKYFGDLLENSIKLRLRSDVPVGSCLSGGLDSSTIVTLASKGYKREAGEQAEFYTFTSTVPGSKIDETYYSDIIVNETNSRSVKINPNIDSLKEDMEKLIYHQEEPFQSLSIYASWLVMKEARNNNISVLLDGQGADEILLGYEMYYSYIMMDYLKNKKFKEAVRLFKESANKSKLNIFELAKYLIYFGIPKVKETYKTMSLKSKYNKNFLNEFPYPKEVKDFTNIKNIEDLHYKSIYMGLQRLLKWEDKNSMAHSIETRIPFLDYRVVECAINSPVENKLYGGWLKSLLRGFMKDKMSDEVVYRKNKFGFPAPDEELIDSLDDDFIHDLLNNSRSKEFFNFEYLKVCFELKKDTSIRFTFIVIELWMRIFNII